MKTLEELAVGTKVKCIGHKQWGENVEWIILEHDHEGDPENSTTLMMDKLYFDIAFDAKEPENTDQGCVDRGNPSYKLSNVLQWLNSDSERNMWYTPQHEYDHPPNSTDYVFANPYESYSGFLNSFPKKFKNNLLEISKTYYDFYEKTKEEITRKIHLLSFDEVGFELISGMEQEGVKYEFFTNDESRIAKYYSNLSATPWVLRTGDLGIQYNYYFNKIVNSYGKSTATQPFIVNCIRPICAISKTTIVSDEPDEKRVYTLIFQSEPDDSWIPPDGIWREPKTNWTAEDRFNFKDYNRILNNIVHLKEQASGLKKEFKILDMGLAINSYEIGWNVDCFNAFETNIDIINKNLMSKDYGYRQTFYPNGIFIGFSELNRIESAILSMKSTIDGIIAGRRKLPFRLGAPKGIAV